MAEPTMLAAADPHAAGSDTLMVSRLRKPQVGQQIDSNHEGVGKQPVVRGAFAFAVPLAKDDWVSTADLPDAASWLTGVRRLAVLTGAGISTDSGIPDFRGPAGVWTQNPAAEKMATYQAYVADTAVRRRSWQNRLTHPAWTAEPNAAHVAIARIAARIDTWVITQNIDGLHQRSGVPDGRVLELHGTMHGVVCVGCAARTQMSDALARVRAGEEDPSCTDCGGILKSATVMFGQALDPQVFAQAVAAAQSADLLLAIGSTLIVEPAASLCRVAVRSGAHLVIVNRDPTPYDPIATAVIRQPIGEAVPAIADRMLERTVGRDQAS